MRFQRRDVGTGIAGRNRAVLGINSQDISVRRAGRRAGTTVTDLPEIVARLYAPARRMKCWGYILRQGNDAGWEIIEHPVRELAARRIGIG